MPDKLTPPPDPLLSQRLKDWWNRLATVGREPEIEPRIPWVPETFPKARQTMFAVEPRLYREGRPVLGVYYKPDLLDKMRSKHYPVPEGVEGSRYPMVGVAAPPDRSSQLAGDVYTSGAPQHEVAHAIWYNDLPQEMQEHWATMHILRNSSIRPRLWDWRTTRKDYEKDFDYNRIANYPDYVIRESYPGDPAHSFAELFGVYMRDPGVIRESDPEMFNFFQKISGRPELPPPPQMESSTTKTTITKSIPLPRKK